MGKMVQKAAVKAGKKKKWFKIVAPAIFNQAEVGEILLYDPEASIGRVIRVNLMVLTRDPKKQDKEVGFILDGRKESFITSSFKSYEMVPSTIKRLMRKGKSKIEDSFDCQTKDAKKLRIKPVVITKSRVNRKTRADLRRQCNALIREGISKLEYENFITALVMEKFQKQLQDDLKKIVPISVCKIRMMQLLS